MLATSRSGERFNRRSPSEWAGSPSKSMKTKSLPVKSAWPRMKVAVNPALHRHEEVVGHFMQTGERTKPSRKFFTKWENPPKSQ